MFGFVDNNPGFGFPTVDLSYPSDPWQYPQVSGGVPGSNGGTGTAGVIEAAIQAAGGITSSIINNKSQADLLKYSAVGSPGFLYTSGVAGQRPAVATIGSTTLILIALAAVVVLFLFTRKG